MRVLSDHQNELEVVHAQRDVIQLVHVREEDDVLDGVLDNVCVVRCTCQLCCASRVPSCPRAHSRLTLQGVQHAEAGLIVCRPLANVRGEDCLDVLHDVPLEDGSEGVADRVDLVAGDPVTVSSPRPGLPLILRGKAEAHSFRSSRAISLNSTFAESASLKLETNRLR